MVAMIINYQKQQLTTTGIYSLTVLEIRCLTRICLPGLKSRCCLNWFLLEAQRGENLFPCLYHLLEASYILWLVAASFIFRSITPVSASVLVHLLLQFRLLLSPSLKDHSDDSGSTRIIQEPHLKDLTCWIPPLRPQVRGLGTSECEYIWGSFFSLPGGFPHNSVGKESACNAGDPGSIPGLEDPLEKG